MMHCRTLARPATRPDDAAATAAAFAQALSARLRRRGLAAATISVLLSGTGDRTGPRMAAQALPAPSSGAAEWAAVAATLARRLWQPGTSCKRIGVLALDLAPVPQAAGLLADPRHARDARISEVIDTITARYGPASIGIGHAGLRQPRPWTMRQQHLSPGFTDHSRSFRLDAALAPKRPICYGSVSSCSFSPYVCAKS